MELIFSILASFIFFKERISKNEFIGMALISASVWFDPNPLIRGRIAVTE